MSDGAALVVHRGSCHCGRVRFEIDAPTILSLNECNCSICSMTGFLHLIVRKDHFRLTSGEKDLCLYQFNTGVARHYFCGNCGIKSFYVPRSNPEGYSVNGNCLDPATIESTAVLPFDGVNWEDNAASLAHLTD